jgi:hypothetical protein
MSIRLHIDRLIVDGLPLTAREAHALRANVEMRLAELFAGAAAARPTAGCALDALSTAPIAWGAPQANPGHRIADSLHTALTANLSRPAPAGKSNV